MSRTMTRALALTASALTLALATSACSLLSFGPRTSAFSMKVGQCVQLPTGDNITDLETTDCSALHDAEVFHLTQVTEDERPSDSELEDMAATPAWRPSRDTWASPTRSPSWTTRSSTRPRVAGKRATARSFALSFPVTVRTLSCPAP